MTKVVLVLIIVCLLTISVHEISGQPAIVPGPGDCLVDGVVRRNGERFQIKCSGRCTCANGHFGCVSMCPPFIAPMSCREVKKAGQCCVTTVCPSTEARKEKCQSKSLAEVNDTFEPQWAILLRVTDGGKSGVCLASILDSTHILTNPNCIKADTTIAYPASAATSHVRPVSAPQSRPVATAQLDPAVEFLPSIHEINKPYKKACENKDCALFIAAYDPNAKKMRLVVGQPTAAEMCNLNPVDIANNVSCLKITNGGATECLNFDGAGVAIKDDNDIFYLVGLLTDGPFFATDNNKCDLNQSPYKKFRRLCDADRAVD